jgi:hypothetical protein
VRDRRRDLLPFCCVLRELLAKRDRDQEGSRSAPAACLRLRLNAGKLLAARCSHPGSRAATKTRCTPGIRHDQATLVIHMVDVCRPALSHGGPVIRVRRSEEPRLSKIDRKPADPNPVN